MTSTVPTAGGDPGILHSRPILLAAFAFAVMADPVSSVAYAIEAALRALRADLGLLLPTMALVVLIIALVIRRSTIVPPDATPTGYRTNVRLDVSTVQLACDRLLKLGRSSGR